MEFTEEVTNNIEKKLVTAGIFIDLKKAFDTVNHEILLKKLENYGVRGITETWIKSYLSNRKQYTDIDGTKSKEHEVICGVPQGSVLGPKLFLTYLNDITNASNLLKFILFADDTTILCSHANIQELEKTLNHELSKLNNWFSANKLSLNVAKTNNTIFKNNFKNRHRCNHWWNKHYGSQSYKISRPYDR